MRMGIWVYLDVLARLPRGVEQLEIDPGELEKEMGLPEATIRSWLGHLRKAGYLDIVRLNGKLQVTIKKGHVPEPPEVPQQRVFTVQKLQRMLKDKLNLEALEDAITTYPDSVIRRALAGALAPPEDQIRRSRTALFLYLLKRYAHESS
jgi:hypothetical protein